MKRKEIRRRARHGMPGFCGMLLIGLIFCFCLTPVHALPRALKNAAYDKNADSVNEVIRKEYNLHSDGSFDYHLFMKTKIITYRGKKQNGDMKIPYNAAWETVHVNSAGTKTVLPDGTVIPVRADEINDIQDPSTSGSSLYSSARLRVINFPSVEPGVSVEVDVMIHSCRPGMKAFWKREFFALAAPTTKKVVVLHAPESMPLHWEARGRCITVDIHRSHGTVTYTWRGARLPEIKDEPHSPPALQRCPVLFISTLDSFRDVAAFYNSLVPWRDYDISLNRLPEDLKDLDDPDALYIRLMSMFIPYPINFLDTDLKCQPPEVTFNRGYGTPVQLAWLFQSILKAKGIPCEIVAVSGNFMIRGLPLPFMPDLFTHLLVRSGNRWYCFDRKELSPGVTGLESHAALSLADGTYGTVRDAFESIDLTSVNMTYNSLGTASGTLLSLITGKRAADTRKGFRYLSGPELEVARSMVLHAIDPFARGDVCFAGLDLLRRPVEIKVDFTIPELHYNVYDSSFFPIPTSSFLQKYVDLSTARENSLWFPDRCREILIFMLEMPAGTVIKSLPESFSGTAGPFSWDVMVRQSGRTVYYVRTLAVKRGIMKTCHCYEKFLAAFRKLSAPGQGIVMFH